jgi:predicted nucleic acid-binding protein
MPVFYVESSALLKRYKSEIGSAVVAELLDGRTANDYFLTSHFSILEAIAVVARLLKGGLDQRGGSRSHRAHATR